MSNGNFLKLSPTVDDVSVMSFTNVESNSHFVNEATLDLSNTSSNGFLGHMSNENVSEVNPILNDTSTLLFPNVESNSHFVNEAVLNFPNTSSNGFCLELARKYSFQDISNLYTHYGMLSSIYLGECVSFNKIYLLPIFLIIKYTYVEFWVILPRF